MPSRVAQLRRGLEAALRQQTTPAGASASSDPQTLERLRSLGYLGGSSSKRAGASALRDPKDGVRFLPRLNRAMSAARIEPAVAIRELTSVLAEDSSLFMARRTRAVAYASAGRHDLAIADMRALEKRRRADPGRRRRARRQPAIRRTVRRRHQGAGTGRAREPEIPAAAHLARRGADRTAQISRRRSHARPRAEAGARLHRSAAPARRSRVPPRRHGRCRHRAMRGSWSSTPPMCQR